MLKKALIYVAVFAALLMFAVTWLTARTIDREKIARLEAERAALNAKHEILTAQVAERDSVQDILKDEIAKYKEEANGYREQVDDIEAQRRADQLSVRTLRREDELQQRLRDTFPEMAGSDWGVTDVYNEAEDLDIKYLLVPLWFSETFIIDHLNSVSYQAQRDKLLLVDSLQARTIALQDSIYVLEHINRLEYERGYYEAFAMYTELSGDYISHLKDPPKISLGFPRLGTIVGAALAGVAVGVAIN